MRRGSIHLSDGTVISFLDSRGSGPVVVVLHGLAGNAAEFIATARALRGYRVLLMDQRGHGRSTRRPPDTTREAFVNDVACVIESQTNAPAVLIGQSMGAHTAMLTAAARPDLVDRLILLEGDAGGSDPTTAQMIGAFFRSWPVPFPDRASAAAFLGDGPHGSTTSKTATAATSRVSIPQ